MKKIITFCFFAFALLFSTQSLVAQNKIDINEKASLQAKALKKQLKFDDNTLEQIYLAYQSHGNDLANSNELLTTGSVDYNAAKQKSNVKLQTEIKEALGDEIFARYLMVSGEKDITNTTVSSQNKGITTETKSR